MSTLMFAALTNKHDSSSQEAPSGVKTYVDSMAALVPVEVLALHALIVSMTMSVQTSEDGTFTVQLIEPFTLQVSFFALIGLSMVLYLIPRIAKKKALTGADLFRVLIPPVAFVAWAMLQKGTAFDAVVPGLRDVPRVVFALFLAVIVAAVAAALAQRAENGPVR